MLITLVEILGLIIVTLYLGYLFSGFIKISHALKRFDWQDIKFASLVAAPAVILHELAHKFTAIAFGFEASFFAFYQSTFTLFLALLSILFKFLNFPFIFIIPGFVEISPTVMPNFQTSMIALAGPLTNLILFIIATIIIKTKNLTEKKLFFWVLTQRINIFLFLFNMIPIGLFDGGKVLAGLINAF